VARRWRRGEIWRGTLCGYGDTRKQEEHGEGRHMSARAGPQESSGEVWLCGTKGAVLGCRVLRGVTLVRKARWYTRAEWQPSTSEPGNAIRRSITPGKTALSRGVPDRRPGLQGQGRSKASCRRAGVQFEAQTGHKTIGVVIWPLTSSSFDIVSSKLVTLPLGPVKN
jgi:hypothetical protein